MAVHDLQSVPGIKIVYVFTGIPDICTLKRDRSSLYEENFLDMDKDHVNHFKKKNLFVQEQMEQIGCKVVFCTIPTINFSMWNAHRLKIIKTKIILPCKRL